MKMGRKSKTCTVYHENESWNNSYEKKVIITVGEGNGVIMERYCSGNGRRKEKKTPFYAAIAFPVIYLCAFHYRCAFDFFDFNVLMKAPPWEPDGSISVREPLRI